MNKNIRIIHHSVLIIFATVVLSFLGCGGHDGGGGGNAPPTANAGPDQSVEEQSIVNLVGSGTDSDGTIASYAWKQTSGFAVTLSDTSTAAATFTAPTVTEQKVAAFRLTVTDNDGATASDEVTVTVNPANAPPTCDAGPDQFVPEQTLVTLDGTASADSDGPVSYTWSQTGGTAVDLSGDHSAIASFTAPEVTELLTFRLTVTDNEGATDSDDVNVSVVNILFSEDFDDVPEGDQPPNWTVVNDSGNTGDWQVNSDEYHQLNFVEDPGNPFIKSYHLGTYSYLDYIKIGNKTSYRFSVEVTPLPDYGDDLSQGNDVGVMFRYQHSSDSYYRFTLNSRYGFSRLEKKVNGIFSTLAVDSAGYYEGETLRITIAVNGSLIQVYLDDEPLFGVSDSDINSGTISLYCQDKAKFDNVLVTENNLAPAIVISSPVAYSIATTDTDTLNVSAIATNVPLGGEVEFVLDDATSITVSSSPYTAQFFSVSRGEHTVHAILRDGSGSELVRDTNVQIGVLGDYYVAVGDSITNGEKDDDPSDNISNDGRTIAIQGYEANLNDLLTSTLDYPHIVFNEGIGGDKSEGALGRIDSILTRHPGSNKVLILLGTNDATNGVSQDDFEQNMKYLVKKVVDAGKEAWVALIPPNLGKNGTVDENIQDYNDIIITELIAFSVGPDFYTIEVGPDFYEDLDNPSFFDADGVHPNGLGYAVMANLWHDKLSQ